MKRTKAPESSEGRTARRAPAKREPLDNGQEIREVRTGQIGEIVDHACQYAHPKADPVYNYLIRWDDGQVQAISEAALTGGNGFEVVD